MLVFDGIVAAGDAIRRFYYRNDDTLPDVVRAKVEPRLAGTLSPVDLAVAFVEAVYANRDDVPAEGLEVAAGVAQIIYESGFHGGLDGRAQAMIPALRRDSGEEAPDGVTWPHASDDPAVNADYTVPVPIELPPVPVPSEG